MSNIIINNRKNAIEITKEFQKKASIFNSPEYNELKAAKQDNPSYRVYVKSGPKKKIEDRMTLNDMRIYIENHSGKESAQMNTFNELRGISVKQAGNVGDAVEAAKFHEIKEWFFMTYPEIGKKTENRQMRIKEILAEAEAKAKSKAEADANTNAA